MRHSDEHLDYWGDCFVAVSGSEHMDFQRFLALPGERRISLLNQWANREGAEAAAEQVLPEGTELHGGVLRDPMRHYPTRTRRSWLFEMRCRLKRARALRHRRRS